MSDRLMHYAEQPMQLAGRAYRQHDPRSYSKPCGLWVSVEGEDDWPNWCRSEGYALDRLAAAHEVTLTDTANILWLRAPEDLDRFTDTYAVRQSRSYRRHKWTDVAIDWTRVASEFDGIIITPYQWRRRMGLDWYSGWDCASGCIWNLEAIARLELITEVVA